jgi:long-chain acyl-CoA synthetase
LTTSEIVKFAVASNPRGIVLSDEKAREHATLREAFDAAGLNEVRIWNFDDVFALPDEAIEAARVSQLPARVTQQTVASLIFTSGTTGQPKGVMLTHKNLANMVSMLASVFEMDTSDGVLSVLPLHHTFEFSTGFLTPLSRGAQITYLTEVNREELARGIKNGHVTGMVGVPAVWEALHRRIMSRMSERGRLVENLTDGAIEANRWLRNNTPFNLGQIIFRPIHTGLGGRIRYLISGGSALSDKVKRDFHGLGFTILEGYGLTEASPVLTVVPAQNKLIAGSVGLPVPGVEVRIADADASGVGEVIARGANIMLGYFDDEAATRAVIRDRWLYTGDLGRLDDDGNLYLVGRSKDIIIDTNGKNIYPDEIEELYKDSPFIKELSVVGLPETGDATGERVACMVVPDYDHDIALSRAETHRRIEEHFRDVSSTLPFHKRVKVMHFTDKEFTRTSTRKIKRGEVLARVQAAEETARTAGTEQTQLAPATSKARDRANDTTRFTRDLVAHVANKPVADVTLDTRLTDLGFDSLMFVELATAIEASGATLRDPDTLVDVQSVRELHARITRAGHTATAHTEETAPRQDKADEIYVPSFVRTVGKSGLGLLQHAFYEKFFNTTYEGRTNIPPHTNFIVAPNHVSHLDMGLVKMALGEYGRDMVALAAADYFFDNKYKRAYMDNFTNLVPMERSGSLRQSLRHARSYLDRGYNALLFPEGTRSTNGELLEFKPIIGHIALSSGVGILPVYIHGTYESLPKGANITNIINSRDIGARIGRFLSIEELERLTEAMPKHEAYRLVAALIRHEVENLRDRTHNGFDAKALRRRWRAERRSANGKAEHDEQLAGAGD